MNEQPFVSDISSNLPLISCVMPTYGRPVYVNESVQMFLEQDYPHKELIILNDCVGQEFEFDHSEVRIFNSKHRYATLGEKRNATTELARGEVIAVWDDDDIYLPWRLSLSVSEMIRTKTPFYRVAAFWAYWGESELHDNRSIPGWDNHPSVLYTKEIWRQAGGYSSQDVGEDVGLLQRIHVLLDQKYIKHPLQKYQRVNILRGKSYYVHMSIDGGKHPLDEQPGHFPISPQAITDPVLRDHYERLIRGYAQRPDKCQTYSIESFRADG